MCFSNMFSETISSYPILSIPTRIDEALFAIKSTRAGILYSRGFTGIDSVMHTTVTCKQPRWQKQAKKKCKPNYPNRS